MTLLNEQDLENYCMEYFRQIGYQTAFGPDILPEGENPLRADVRQPFLPENIKAALRRLNPAVSEDVLQEAFRAYAAAGGLAHCPQRSHLSLFDGRHFNPA